MSDSKKEEQDSSPEVSEDEYDISEELEKQAKIVREKSLKKKEERLTLQRTLLEREEERNKLKNRNDELTAELSDSRSKLERLLEELRKNPVGDFPRGNQPIDSAVRDPKDSAVRDPKDKPIESAVRDPKDKPLLKSRAQRYGKISFGL